MMRRFKAEDPARVQKFIDVVPKGRPAEISEVVDMVAFLARPENRFITGQDFSVNGGSAMPRARLQHFQCVARPVYDRVRKASSIQYQVRETDMAEKFPARWVMAGRVKTRYIDVGGEEPVLMALHGGGAGSSGSAGMGKLAGRLKDHMRVVAPDQVGGFGWTDPEAPTPYGQANRVDHLEDFADALCIDKMHLVGNSQGAWVAARYAVLHPDRVKSMVLIGSGTLGKSMGLPFPPSPGLAALMGFDGTREAMRRMMLALVTDPSNITEELIDERLASATRPGAAESMKRFGKGNQYLENDPSMVGVFSLRESLPAVTKVIPTTVIWGEADTFVLPETGRQFEKLLPDARFFYIPGAGHQTQTDATDEVARLVRETMAKAG